jgi:hypothetical protein
MQGTPCARCKGPDNVAGANDWATPSSFSIGSLKCSARTRRVGRAVSRPCRPRLKCGQRAESIAFANGSGDARGNALNL